MVSFEKWLLRLLLAFGLIAAWASLAAPAMADARDSSQAARLEAAEQELLAGRYEAVKRSLRDLRKRIDTPASDPQLRGRLYLLAARTAAAYEDAAGVRAELGKLKALGLEPALSVYTDPPLLFDEWKKLGAGASVDAPGPEAGRRSANAPSSPSTGSVTPEPPSPAAAATPQSSEAVTPAETRRKAQGYAYLVPFGVGHFAHDEHVLGAAFLGAGLASVYTTVQLTRESEDEEPRTRGAYTLASILTPLSIYGLELLSHRDGLAADAPATADSVQSALGLFPLGAPQLRNGQIAKGVAVGAAQALALAAWANGDRSTQLMGMLLLGLSYTYSVYDGWLHAVPWTSQAQALRLEVSPFRAQTQVASGGGVGVLASASFDF
jgi:hypothetical protein